MGLADWFRRKHPEERPLTSGDPCLSAAQRDTIDDIVSLYETGQVEARKPYDTVTILSDGAGISYGIHQATARAGSLQTIIEDYYARGGLLRIDGDALGLDTAKEIAARSVRVTPGSISREVRDLMSALARAAQEPIMRAAQRNVFDTRYWLPSYEVGRALGLRYALSYLALYDLSIHSGPPRSIDDTSSRLWKLRQRFPEYPPSHPLSKGERLWTLALLRARDGWLGEYYPATAYRTRSLLDLCERGSTDRTIWHLAIPLEVRIWRPKSGMETHTIGAGPLDPPPAPRRVA